MPYTPDQDVILDLGNGAGVLLAPAGVEISDEDAERLGVRTAVKAAAKKVAAPVAAPPEEETPVAAKKTAAKKIAPPETK